MARFKDDGYSAFKEIRRDDFVNLIGAIERDEVDVVIVRDVERLTRNRKICAAPTAEAALEALRHRRESLNCQLRKVATSPATTPWSSSYGWPSSTSMTSAPASGSRAARRPGSAPTSPPG